VAKRERKAVKSHGLTRAASSVVSFRLTAADRRRLAALEPRLRASTGAARPLKAGTLARILFLRGMEQVERP
jgi:hypothetical protein